MLQSVTLPEDLQGRVILTTRNRRANRAFNGTMMLVDPETLRRLETDPRFTFDATAELTSNGGFCVVGDDPHQLFETARGWFGGPDQEAPGPM